MAAITKSPFEFIYLPARYEEGVLVTSLPLNNTWNLKVVLIHFSLVLIIMFLHNLIFLRRNSWLDLFAFNGVLAISLSQSTSLVQRKSRLIGSRVFLGAATLLFFILSIFYITFIITYHMSFVPDHRIKTMRDVEENKIPIKTRTLCILNEKTTDIWNWNHSQGKEKVAYIEDMLQIRIMLTSATNLDEYERKKYYLLNKLHKSMSFSLVTPLNSPYGKLLKDMVIRNHEAGLRARWLQEEFQVKKKFGYRHFPEKILYGKSDPRPYKLNDMAFPYLLLFIGLSMSAICVVVEIVVHYYSEKRRITKERKREEEFWNRIFERYNHFLEE